MKEILFVLYMTLINPDVHYIGGNPHIAVIAASPDDAAVQLYQQNRTASIWEHWDGKLYEVVIDKGTVKAINIPKMKFE